MSNVSTKPFVPMNTEYPQLNQPPVQVNKPLELSPSADNVSKFLKDSSPAPKENNLTINKESLEKLFAMFEFAIKAMRSMLAGMGGLPKMPGELDAQSQLKPGHDPKVAADTSGKPKIEPQTDAKTQVKPGPDPKVVADTSVKSKIEPQADTKTQVKPGSEVKVPPEGRTQVTLTPDGKPVIKPATPSLIDTAQPNKTSTEVSVTVQVQSCHCPHTDEKVAPQPGLTPMVNVQPSPQPVVTPKIDVKPSPQPPMTTTVDKQPSPQPAVTTTVDKQPAPQPAVSPSVDKETLPKPLMTTNVDKQPLPQPAVTPKPDTRPTPDLTSPAPADLAGDVSRHSRNPRPSLRSRF